MEVFKEQVEKVDWIREALELFPLHAFLSTFSVPRLSWMWKNVPCS